MKKLLLLVLLVSQFAFGVTANKVWRIPSGATLPAWGPVNLADGTNAITGMLASKANLPAFGQQISSSCGNFTTTSATAVDVTNLTVTIVTSGRPVLVMLVPDATASDGYVGASNNGGGAGTFYTTVHFLRAGTIVASVDAGGTMPASSLIRYPPSGFQFFDIQVAGSYNYKIQVKQSGSGLASMQAMDLVAYEF